MKSKSKKLIKTCEKCYFKIRGDCKDNTPCELGMTESKFRLMVINLLRKGTFYWKPRAEALKRARVATSTVKCARCGDWICDGAITTFEKVTRDAPADITVRMSEVKLDHNPSVIDERGFTNWNDYITRMFCFVDHFDVLCKECHDEKTETERQGRKSND